MAAQRIIRNRRGWPEMRAWPSMPGHEAMPAQNHHHPHARACRPRREACVERAGCGAARSGLIASWQPARPMLGTAALAKCFIDYNFGRGRISWPKYICKQWLSTSVIGENVNRRSRKYSRAGVPFYSRERIENSAYSISSDRSGDGAEARNVDLKWETRQF